MPTERVFGDLYDYEPWDTSPIPLPPRSRLYHLEPVGVGTGAVESLTSYFTRLAGFHSVSLHPLAVKVVAPLLDPERVWWSGATTHIFFKVAARTMSGIGEIAETWTRALATLTMRDDLRSLTLIPWSSVMSALGLLQKNAAWCPACYEEWSVAGEIVYQPLLWHLAAVTACPRHGRALSTRCPHPGCGAAQKLLSTSTQLGYCSACAGWLGSAEPPGPEQVLDDATLTWQSWVHETIGAMLADAATRAHPFGAEDLMAAFVACTATMGHINLARVTGLGPTMLTGWRLGHQVPSLPRLLQFCHRLGTTPLRLLTEQSPTLCPTSLGGATVSSRRVGRAPLDWGRIRAALVAQVREPDAPPPSLKEMARRLDCSAATLARVVPADTAIIVARARAHREQRSREVLQGRVAEVRRVTLERHAAELGTTMREVKAALANPMIWWTPDIEYAYRAALVEVGVANEETLPPPAAPRRVIDPRLAAPLGLTLTDEERRALTAALAGGVTALREQRLRAILLLDEGQRPDAVAHTIGVGPATIYAWAKAWRARGLAGLDDVHGGPAPTFDATTSQPLAERLAASPAVYGYRQTVWTSPMLHTEMAKLGYSVCRTTVQRAAEQLGWYPQRTVPVPPVTPLLTLTTEEEGLLQRTLVAEGHEPHRRRIQAILLLARGEATRTVAATVGVSVGSIHSWAKAWSAGGLRGLVGRSGVARNPVIDASAKRLLEERLSAAPGAYGHVATAWTLALLQAELAETGCVVVHGTVWSALKLLGWRYARPGYVKVSPIGCRSGRPE